MSVDRNSAATLPENCSVIIEMCEAFRADLSSECDCKSHLVLEFGNILQYEFLHHYYVIHDHGPRRDCRLLSAVSLAPGREVELAIAASGLEFGVVCLAFDTASNSSWSCLRGIRWGLYHHRNSVALGCRWYQTESLGLTRRGSLFSWNEYHHVVTENLIGLKLPNQQSNPGLVALNAVLVRISVRLRTSEFIAFGY